VLAIPAAQADAFEHLLKDEVGEIAAEIGEVLGQDALGHLEIAL
jgi:hypothetical protein